jgi:hypothetical protein
VCWVECKREKRSKCMQEQIQQLNAIQHCSGSAQKVNKEWEVSLHEHRSIQANYWRDW